MVGVVGANMVDADLEPPTGPTAFEVAAQHPESVLVSLVGGILIGLIPVVWRLVKAPNGE